jgi:hypothetical protein
MKASLFWQPPANKLRATASGSCAFSYLSRLIMSLLSSPSVQVQPCRMYMLLPMRGHLTYRLLPSPRCCSCALFMADALTAVLREGTGQEPWGRGRPCHPGVAVSQRPCDSLPCHRRAHTHESRSVLITPAAPLAESLLRAFSSIFPPVVLSD